MPQPFRSALVTGASSGIGEQIARVLAQRGCALTLVARRADRLAALADDLRPAVKVDCLTADLATEAGVELVEQTLQHSPVELLVNNAGVGTGGLFHELPPEGEIDEVRLNVLAVLRLTRAALPAMVAAGRGGILNVSSMAGNQPLVGFATYAATKAFVTSFSESISFDLRGTGVHVTVCKPGYTDTEMNFGQVPDEGSLQRRFLWLEADQVARDAIDAVERGKLHSVPGTTWRMADALIETLPRGLVRALSGRIRTS